MGLKIDRRAKTATKIACYIAVFAFAACLFKIWLWEHSYYQSKTSEIRNPEQAVITELADAVDPSEIAPTAEDIAKYQVYTTSPRYIEIPRLTLKARVRDSNVTEYVMPVPNNIYDVAWYAGSGNPGQGGDILMSGISQGSTKPGAFANLDTLEKGDDIYLERGDGERFGYEVREILIIDKEEAKNKLPLAQKRIDDKETLALITARRADENDKEFNSIVMIRATIK